MKKIFKLSFFVFFLFGIGSVKAQIYVGDGIFINNFQPNLVTTNLNVGIGTNTPTEKLHVVGNILATAIKKSGGTASQFLKANGSVDSSTYLTTTSASSTYALKANPTFSGTFSGTFLLPATATAPTAVENTNTTQLATTAFVTTATNLKANIASPIFTGNPTAPTAVEGTNTNQLATTAFVATANSLKENILSFTSPLVRNSNAISINNASASTTGVLTSTDWNTFNNKLSALSVTANGTSGPATLSGSVLNIPQYTGGSGGTQSLQQVTDVSGFTTNPILIYVDRTNYYGNSPLQPVHGLKIVNKSINLNNGGLTATGITSMGAVGGSFVGGNFVSDDTSVDPNEVRGYGIGVQGYSDEGIGVKAYSDAGTGLLANSNEGTGIDAYSSFGYGIKAVSGSSIGLWAYTENNSGVAIKATMEENDGKGIVIASDDYSTGNPLEITKNNVAKLVVNQQGEITATKFKIHNGAPDQFLMADGTTSTGATASTIYNTDGTLSGARTVAMGTNPINFNGTGNYMINAGNVGIGTTNPITKFHVDGDINATGLTRKIGFSVDDIDPLTSRARYGLTQLSNYTITGETNYTRPGVAMSGYFGLSFFTGDSEVMRISDWGNVGIGTTTPDEKLAVNGNIHTKEVRVDLVGWPDFVFKKDYNLPTLQEVENHIKDKGHLKDIPSEKEVVENGVKLGEMNSKLLQKVEELTLYLIQQNKDIEVLKEENEKYKSLVERVTALEKQ